MAIGNASPSVANTNLNYSVTPEDGSKAYLNINADPTTGKRASNYATEARPASIENVRGKEDSVSLDTTGFQFYHAPATHKSFSNDDEIEREYIPESIELLKSLTGASKVVIFDHTVRRRRPGVIDDGPSKRQPAAAAHVDQTNKSAVDRVRRHLPEEAEERLKKRFQLINLWRPISHPAHDWPLALCDFRSVKPSEDTFPVSLLYPDREGETMGIKYSPDYQWKYLYGMTPEEIVLIKCYDSLQDGSVALFTPHTAFEDPNTPADAPLRESIEIRALVFYD